MHFYKNEKTLENIGKSNIFKGFSYGGEGEIRTLYFSFRHKDFVGV